MALALEERASELRHLARTDPDPRVRQRAQIVSLVVQGEPVVHVARTFRTAPHRIRTWRGRFLERGRAGLADLPPTGAPAQARAGRAGRAGPAGRGFGAGAAGVWLAGSSQLEDKHVVEDPARWLQVPVPAGGMELHHCNMLHSSTANRGTKPRSAMVIQYRAADNVALGGNMRNAGFGLQVRGVNPYRVRMLEGTFKLPGKIEDPLQRDGYWLWAGTRT